MGHCLERVCARCDMRVWPLCDVTSAAPSLLQNRYTIALVFSFPPLRLSLSLSPFLPLYYLTCSSLFHVSLFLSFSSFLPFADSSIGKGQRSVCARSREKISMQLASPRVGGVSALGGLDSRRSAYQSCSLSLSRTSHPLIPCITST